MSPSEEKHAAEVKIIHTLLGNLANQIALLALQLKDQLQKVERVTITAEDVTALDLGNTHAEISAFVAGLNEIDNLLDTMRDDIGAMRLL